MGDDFGIGVAFKESASPLEHSPLLTYPDDLAAPVNVDSIQIVIEILDQPSLAQHADKAARGIGGSALVPHWSLQ